MTQAQDEAYVCGVVPEETDARFFSQHLAAYAFARRFVRQKRVLEIGFGEGYGASYLAEVARDVTGIDMAPGNIAIAQGKYRRENLHFRHMEGTRLDFPDGAFDLAGSFQVIEHIPEPRLADHLTEVRRVLAPGGTYCLSTLNLEHNMKPGKPYEKLRYHEKEFTGPQLRELLQQFFPSVEMHGLYLTPRHQRFLRLKRWGLMKLGPARMNPIARFYDRVSVEDYRTKPRVSRHALDLLAVCRKTPSARS